MILKPNIREAVNSLMGAKQRSLLALIGIVVGIGSVIAMVSVGSIVQKEALRQFLEMGTDIITISESFSRKRIDPNKKLSLNTAMAIPAGCPNIFRVAPYTSVHSEFKFHGKKVSIPALGVSPSFMDINKLSLKSGRFIHELDKNMFYCVVGSEIEARLRAQGVRKFPGTRILFKEKYLTIIGVVKEVSMGGMRPYEINRGIMVPISTLKRLSKEAEIKNIIAQTHGNLDHSMIKKQVKDYFARQNSIRVDVFSAEELIAQMQKQMRLFTLLLGTIGSISLIVGGIGVMNIMLVSVTERTREIGIRRALGARQGDILLQFLIESVLLCIIGGGTGITAGAGVSWIIAHYAQWQFSISWNAIGLGVVVAFIVGIFFGIYPARQAARLNPIIALRSD